MKKQRGFSLIELIIVAALIAVLSSVAIPAFTKGPRKARRSEALTALLETQRTYEEFYSQNNRYPTSNTDVPSDTEYYGFSSSTTNTTYTLNATGKNGQTADTEGDISCQNLSIDHTGYTSPPECWRNG